MKANELRELTRWQRCTIAQQAQRIKLLEDKLEEVRKRYFDLKYPEDLLLHPHRNVKLAS